MDQTKKKIKTNQITLLAPDTRVFVTLINPYGEEAQKSLELSVNTTKEELQSILQQLVKTEEDQVYSFFHNNIELVDTLNQLIASDPEYKLENTFSLTYHPQSLFRIQPITRQTAALEGHEQPVLCVQFKTHGDILATGSGDTTIRLWDMLTETPIATLQGHKNWVLCLAWSPDCKYIASGSHDGQVCIWDVQTNQLKGQPLKGHTKWVTSIAWQPMHLDEECTLVASSSKDGSVRIWSRISLSCLIAINAHQKAITKMLWGGQGYIYTASEDTTIGVWNKSGKRLQELKGHGHWVNSIALHSDYTIRCACFSEGNTDINTKQAKVLYDKILNGKNERLVSASDDQTLMLWEYTSSKPKVRMTGHQQQVNHVQFSPDGRYIVSASFDKSLRLWDGYNGSWIATLRGHVGSVYQVSWSSDSRYMLSASKDSTLKLWSLQKKKLAFDLPGHADEVYAVDWAPIGGEKAGSGGKDRRVKIWRH
ncbi:unnamed protein product [Paramecium sonneborni]|uniref:NLE domain-containing protein n=1 Tax=Paramecium sonneborni TaxID=65129 RepID=A0A8S1LL71_9CILI|nr:unnamed protein product [Paramecium sonneborni]